MSDRATKVDADIFDTLEIQKNPATEETSQDILSALVNGGSTGGVVVENAINTSGYNINSAPYSATTNISTDYLLDNIELKFSTAQSKKIEVKSSRGTLIYSDTNSNTSIFLEDIEASFNGGDNITVTVTQTSGACLMDCILTIRRGGADIGVNSGNYNLLYEVTGTYVYIGKSNPGSLSSEAKWQIQRLDTATSKLYYADAVTTFTKVWDDRASFTY